MKNRLIVLLAGMFLGALAACGGVQPEEMQGEVQGEAAQIDPQTKEPFCYACPLEPVQAQGLSTRQPVRNEKTGLYICPPCGDTCGNGICDSTESQYNCPSDCGSGICGDGICGGNESCSTCSTDCGACPSCGDGICQSWASETCSSCSSDCGTCPPPPPEYCGDGICQSWNGENSTNCRADCRYACIYACPLEPVTQ